MRSLSWISLLGLVLLLGVAAGCSDDDDPVAPGPQPLDPAAVDAGLTAALPVAIEFPVGLIEILNAFIPPTSRAQEQCSPLPINLCATSGTAEVCPDSDMSTDTSDGLHVHREHFRDGRRRQREPDLRRGGTDLLT